MLAGFRTVAASWKSGGVMGRAYYMKGPGSRAEQNRAPQGLTMSTLKKRPPLQVLLFLLGSAVVIALGYTARLALFAPEVSWSKKPDPFEYYRNKGYKFMNPSAINFRTACRAPTYEKPQDSQK